MASLQRVRGERERYIVRERGGEGEREREREERVERERERERVERESRERERRERGESTIINYYRLLIFLTSPSSVSYSTSQVGPIETLMVKGVELSSYKQAYNYGSITHYIKVVVIESALL